MMNNFFSRALKPGAFLFSVVCLMGAPSGTEPPQINLPFAESFNSTTLDSNWSTHVAEGNVVEIKEGMLQFQAKPGSRAHIQRTLGLSGLRASFAVNHGDPAATVCLRLFWDASNYTQLGLNKAGRLEAREALGTYPHDYDLGAWTKNQWRTLAIELGEDCIRYLQSEDGVNFKCLRVSPRAARYGEAPRLLVVGQEADAKLFPPGNAWIRPPANPPMGTALVRRVEVRALTPEALKASAAEWELMERAELDVFGEQELASSADPSFESVSRHFPALKWPREAIGVKDNPFAIGVAADGSLQFGPDIANYKKPVAFFQVDGYRFGSSKDACTKSLLNGWMPIVVARDQRDGLEFEQTAFGFSKNFSPDETLYAYVSLRVTNTGKAARKIEVDLLTEPATATSPLKWHIEVPAGGSRSIEARLPCNELAFPPTLPTHVSVIGKVSPEPKPAEHVTAKDFKSALQLTTKYWDQLVAKVSPFEIPEARVQNACRAWIAYNFLHVSKRDEIYHVCDGSGFYGRVYGYSAALYCNKLDLLGYHDMAGKYLESLLSFVQTNGLLAVNFGSTDTGAALWAISEHYWITRDAEWLRRVAPRMVQMCGWILEQRRLIREKPGQLEITKGLIRYRPYADLLHPAADYFSNSYLQKGLAAAAAVLAEIGMRGESERFKSESLAYRNDITASMEKAVFTDRGMKILPAIPDTVELWKEANGSANGYYGIIVPCMLEAGLPAWDDPKAMLLVNALEKRGGLVAGVSRFHNMADHAYAYGYWMNCLQRDEVKKAILGLYGSMAYGMSHDTYSAVECTHIQTGENYWTLPHTYSNTQQLRLLRNMMVREDGEKLRLAQAVPRPWLGRGKRVAINRAPTTFGPVSYSIEAGKDGSMRLRIEPPTRQSPAEILVHVRHPDHLKIARVQSKRPAGLSFSGETIRLERPSKAIDLKLSFK